MVDDFCRIICDYLVLILCTNLVMVGPNLVSYDEATGTSYVDIPEDDDNINRLVYEAEAAVCLTDKDIAHPDSSSGKTLVMVTVDGSDSCLPGESYCGIVAPDAATMMLEVFNCKEAMAMDNVKH